jgi:hypothetical protein
MTPGKLAFSRKERRRCKTGAVRVEWEIMLAYLTSAVAPVACFIIKSSAIPLEPLEPMGHLFGA